MANYPRCPQCGAMGGIGSTFPPCACSYRDGGPTVRLREDEKQVVGGGDSDYLRSGFKVGSLTLRPGYGGDPDRVWIERNSEPSAGEGADFPVDEVEAVLQAYYTERF